jgi:hypothetical protein
VPGIDQESAPFFGERNLVSSPVQKAHTQFLFQIVNLAGERGLRQMQFLGGAREV